MAFLPCLSQKARADHLSFPLRISWQRFVSTVGMDGCRFFSLPIASPIHLHFPSLYFSHLSLSGSASFLHRDFYIFNRNNFSCAFPRGQELGGRWPTFLQQLSLRFLSVNGV